MEITPRYGNEAILVLDGPDDAVHDPAVRQSCRLLELVKTFDGEQCARPSRCQGWSNRDVISHLGTTNQFWTMSIDAGLRGEPSRFLASFDPVTTPAHLVDDTRTWADDEVLERFETATTAFIDVLDALDPEAWGALAEAPPGHIAIGALVHHALWDSWTHERDICLPLGISSPCEPDEIAASLRYVAALGPAFAATDATNVSGTLVVAATDPEVTFEVDIGERVDVRSISPELVRSSDEASTLLLTGSAIDLLEGLSTRAPLPPIPRGPSVDGVRPAAGLRCLIGRSRREQDSVRPVAGRRPMTSQPVNHPGFHAAALGGT